MGGRKLDTTSEVFKVERPARVSPRLRGALGVRTHTAARDALVVVLSEHPTYREAAEDLGVDVKTLRAWRRAYRIEVA